MSILLSCQNISKRYPAKTLFSDLDFGVFGGDKIGIIGANGSGKSTLLKVLAGIEEPDSGQVSKRRLLKVGYVAQQSNFDNDDTVHDALMGVIKDKGVENFDAHTQVSIILAKVGFDDPDKKVGALSGGWKKRLSIASALIETPDLLLLDEPTNHLDLEGLLWLEDLLKSAPFSWVLVTHDRFFLEKTATKIAEIKKVYDGGIYVVEGGYQKFLEKRDEYISGKQKQALSLSTKVKREEAWLARGPKARSTKARYRVEEASRLKSELSTLKNKLKTGSTSIDFIDSGRKTKKLVQLVDVKKILGEKTIIEGLDLVLSPGKVIGLLGDNGTGKSTILKLIMGELKPEAGTINYAQDLKVVYFDQNRDQLDLDKTLRYTLCETSDSVIYRDKPVHIVSWISRFQLSQEQLDIPLRELSGGEQARVLIAKLMLKPADLLLLDEPTNDLDIPTLEVLEDSLADFVGAIVLVTHDRYMLDRIASYFIGLDGRGGSEIYADYEQWEGAVKKGYRSKSTANKTPKANKEREKPKEKDRSKKRLTFKEQYEFDQMEEKIMEAEEELERLREASEDPDVVTNAVKANETFSALKKAEDQVEKLYKRWSELEAKTK